MGVAAAAVPIVEDRADHVSQSQRFAVPPRRGQGVGAAAQGPAVCDGRQYGGGEGRDFCQQFTVGSTERRMLDDGCFDGEAAFVDQPVVQAAEQDQVVARA